MARPETYDTKQGKSLLAFLKRHKGEHFDRKGLCQRLSEEGILVSETTVWRYLERLSEEGEVRKTCPDGKSSCYTYGCCDGKYYHLRCSSCKRLLHLACEDMDALREHFFRQHGFAIDPMSTTFGGLCRDCQQEEAKR